MKKAAFVIILTLIWFIPAMAQPSSVSVRRASPLDTNKAAYDERGNALRYYQYQSLLNTGEYTLIPQGDPSKAETKLLLKKLSVEEQVKMMQMVRKFMTINSPVLQEGAVLDISAFENLLDKSSLDDKVLILIFWYANCPPCTESFESFNSFLKRLDPKDAVVIAVTPDNNEIAEAKLAEKPLLYARLVSNGRSVINAYQIRSFPSYVITDRSRVIRLAISGQGPQTIPILQSTLRTQLQGLLR